MSLKELQQAARAFRDERDWKQFHSPKDMALSLSLESSEVLELFQWRDADSWPNRKELAAELSDVLYWVLLIADDAGIDVEPAFMAKLEENRGKYPVSRSHGSPTKHTRL